jgi:hypothetical protein
VEGCQPGVLDGPMKLRVEKATRRHDESFGGGSRMVV